MINSDTKIAVIGLGYVGLPLAVEFGKKYITKGFDINNDRIIELNNCIDKTLELSKEQLISVFEKGLFKVTSNVQEIAECNIYIITVPTPTDKNNRPLLNPLKRASETIGKILKVKDIVIYESTVYPGVTEDECVPILAYHSGLQFNKDFFVGYSPERINPGDKDHTVTKILKVTSGSTKESAEQIDQLYKSIITAGTFKAKSIKVAEAAKVIENSQRDINIAFVNELSKIFNLLNINTEDVLEAANTKWNFLKFKPGLVGGHCIGVDPYYLAQKAQEIGYHPEIILAGRRLNDSMGSYVANQTIKLMIKNGINVKGSEVLILGFTFKEDCPDVRNTKVIDIIDELKSYDLKIDVVDPWANEEEVIKEYNFKIDKKIIQNKKYDTIIVAVGHSEFKKYNLLLNLKNNHVIFDVKGIYPSNIIHGSL